jgi:uncharacterized membrane protein
MDKIKRPILLVSIFFILTVLCVETVLAKSYSYPYINIVLNFEKNGSVFVSQERAYDFRGSFSWAYLDLKKKGSSDIDFIEIRDLDTNTELPYDIQEDGEHVKATWYYTANDEVKRFVIVYEIKDVVKRYNDVAEFYWKVIEDEHEYIRNFNAEVNLPESSPDLFKLFVHSESKSGTMDFSDDLKRVTVSMLDIPKNRFVEFRLLTSPSVFSDVEMINQEKYESILNEEKLNLVQSSIGENAIFIYPILLIPLIIIFLYFYLKYGVEPKVKYEGIYEHEPPMKIPPMALSHLISGRFEGVKFQLRGFIATIFDLARRGYITIKEEVKPQLMFFEKKEQRFILTRKGKKELASSKHKLLDFELLVLKFLFQVVPSGGSMDVSSNKVVIRTKKIHSEVTSSEIVKWNRGKRTGLSFIRSLYKSAGSWFESKHFRIHTKLSMAKSNLFLITSIIYLVLISTLLILTGVIFIPWVIVGGLIIGIFLVIASIPILRKTPESTLALKKWDAFKRFITDFSAMKDAPTTLIHIWDEYLIYAVVLGVAKQLLKVLGRLAEEQHVAFAAAGWYYSAGTVKVPSGVMSPESFSSMVNNLSSTINALSSSTSVGGGFAGGGGGGGGGGGSGAG